VYDVNGNEIRLKPLPKRVSGSNGLEEIVPTKTLNSSRQVDKSSSSGFSKLISEERSTVPDRST
jgi:hypothetical protein